MYHSDTVNFRLYNKGNPRTTSFPHLCGHMGSGTFGCWKQFLSFPLPGGRPCRYYTSFLWTKICWVLKNVVVAFERWYLNRFRATTPSCSIDLWSSCCKGRPNPMGIREFNFSDPTNATFLVGVLGKFMHTNMRDLECWAWVVCPMSWGFVQQSKGIV